MNNEEVRHFYHLHCSTGWEEIAGEHVTALQATSAPWVVTVGLTGPEREQARKWWLDAMPGTHIFGRDEGWEDVTLRVLHYWARTNAPDEPVLYAHSKGIRHPDVPMEIIWRRSMTRHLVTGWQWCTQLLTEGHDTVGCHWLTPEVYHHLVPIPFYGGNFWWATAGYLARLPPLPVLNEERRCEAEVWIGRRSPRAFDLLPGWPSYGLFAQDLIELMNPGVTL